MSSSSSSTSSAAGSLLDLLACCAPGLEPILAAELTERRFEVVREEPGGVAFRADYAGMQRANLELGTALSVLWRAARFKAHDFRELEKRLARLPWKTWLPRGAQLRIRAVSRKSRLYHTGALVDRVTAAVAEPLAPSEDGPLVGLLLRMERDRVTLCIDTSGEPLYRRGYRLTTGPAPLRADVACALLRVAGYDGSTPLVDPMTGTGTLAIEAARLSRAGLPGVKRRFAFEDLPGCDPSALASLRATAGTREGHAPIVARDREPAALKRAQQNADHAGVRDGILWEVGTLSEPSAIDSLDDAWLVANPPYGERLGDARKLERLYAALGQRARQLGGRVAFITSDTRLAARTGLGLESALLTDLGGLKVRFYVSPDRVSPG